MPDGSIAGGNGQGEGNQDLDDGAQRSPGAGDRPAQPQEKDEGQLQSDPKAALGKDLGMGELQYAHGQQQMMGQHPQQNFQAPGGVAAMAAQPQESGAAQRDLHGAHDNKASRRMHEMDVGHGAQH